MNFFEEATLRLKQQLRVTEDKEVAEALGMSAGAWTKRKRRESFPEDKLFALAARRPDLNLDVAYILTGKKMTGLQKVEADFIAWGQADRVREGKGVLPGTTAVLAGLGEESDREQMRAPLFVPMTRWLCTLDDDTFIAAYTTIQRYTLECSKEDRAAIDHIVAALAHTSSTAGK